MTIAVLAAFSLPVSSLITQDKSGIGAETVYAEGEGYLASVRLGAAPGYPATPEFNGEPGEYTFDMPENVTTLGITPTLSEAGKGATITAKWKNQNTGADMSQTATSGSNRNMTWFRKTDMPSGTSFTLEVKKGDDTQVYKFTNRVVSHLTDLSMTSSGTVVKFNETFNTNTTEYTASVVDSTKVVTVSATPYAAGYDIKIFGEKAEEGKKDVNLTEKVTKIPVTVQGEGFEALTYNITVTKVPECKVEFKTVPEDALRYVTDNFGDRLLPGEDGKFTVKAGVEYGYTVTKTGYVAEAGTIKAEADMTKEVTLEKAAENADIDKSIVAQWKNFRGNDYNMAIVDYKTPKSMEMTQFNWAKKLGTGYGNAPTPPIIVEGDLVLIAGKKLYAMDPETGEVVKEGDLVAAPNYSYTPLTYVDGIILCPISGGTVQAINAKTFESLWVYKDALGGQSLSPVTVSNGYAYTGFWNSEFKDAHYACFSLTDEDPENKLEVKQPTWTYANAGGFYWAGSIAVGNYIIVGTDDGYGEGDHHEAHVLVLEALTGKVVDEASVLGDQRSTIAYDPVTEKYFGTTKSGQLFSFKFNKETGKLVDFKKKDYGGMSTSTPVVYKGVVYWGHTSGNNFGGNFSVIASDAETLEENWRAPLLGYPQCSMLLSLAYEAEEGYIYLYSTYNNNPGGITLIKAKPDAKSNDGDNVIVEEIYDAEGYSQYCITSIVCDSEGNLFYKNDTANVLAVGPVKTSLDDLTVTGGDPEWDREFVKSKENYNVTVDPGTETVKVGFTPSEGSIVDINGDIYDSADSIDLDLAYGEADVKITTKSDKYTKTYNLHVSERLEDDTLKSLVVNESNAYGSAKTLTPAFDPAGKEYIVYSAGSSRTFENVWPDTKDPDAECHVFPVSGVRTSGSDIDPETGEIKVTAVNQGHNRYAVYFADGTTKEMTVKITVKAASGDKTTDYYVSITKNATPSAALAQAYIDRIDTSGLSGDEKKAVEDAKSALQDAVSGGDANAIKTAMTLTMKTVVAAEEETAYKAARQEVEEAMQKMVEKTEAILDENDLEAVISRFERKLNKAETEADIANVLEEARVRINALVKEKDLREEKAESIDALDLLEKAEKDNVLDPDKLEILIMKAAQKIRKAGTSHAVNSILKETYDAVDQMKLEKAEDEKAKKDAEAEALADAKAKGIAEVSAVNPEDYVEESQDQIAGAINDAKALIDIMQTPEQVEIIVNAFFATLQEYKTKAEVQEEELKEAKIMAAEAINEYADENIGKADANAVKLAVFEAEGKIKEAETVDDVTNIVKDTKTAIDQMVKDKAAEKLGEVKREALKVLSDFKAENYIDADQQKVANAIAAATSAIAAASKPEDVNAALATFSAAIKDCTTKAEEERKTAELLAEERKLAVKDINDYFAENADRMYDDDRLNAQIVALQNIVVINSADNKTDIIKAVEAVKDDINVRVEYKKVTEAAKAAAKANKVKGLKAKASKQKFIVSWKKNADAEGYDVQYKLSSAKKFSSLKKGVKKTSVKSKKLKKNKKYVFRVRTYKTIRGQKVYGKWVKTKAVKCK